MTRPSFKDWEHGDIYYQLRLVHDGKIAYCCDRYGELWLSGTNMMIPPYMFSSKEGAEWAYKNWANKHPADAQDWVPQITLLEY